jgi:hypothetical protein
MKPLDTFLFLSDLDMLAISQNFINSVRSTLRGIERFRRSKCSKETQVSGY